MNGIEIGNGKTVRDFPWESETQRKGYLSLIQYLRQKGAPITEEVDVALAYLIQKDHESHEWWVGFVSDHIERLQREVHELRKTLECR